MLHLKILLDTIIVVNRSHIRVAYKEPSEVEQVFLEVGDTASVIVETAVVVTVVACVGEAAFAVTVACAFVNGVVVELDCHDEEFGWEVAEGVEVVVVVLVLAVVEIVVDLIEEAAFVEVALVVVETEKTVVVVEGELVEALCSCVLYCFHRLQFPHLGVTFSFVVDSS